MKKYICEGLAKYLAKELRPWHMPGHKRKNFIEETMGEADMNMAAFSALEDKAGEWALNIETILTLAAHMDVTEVSGTDDLHRPEGMIKQSLEQLSKIYGTYASYYLVNGSTSGILAAVGAVAERSSHIIIARNCHGSVNNACELFGLKPIYLQPEYVKQEFDILGGRHQEEYNSYIYGDIKPQQVKALVEANPHVGAVVITSPTYEGVVSDVAGIKKVLEPYNIPLIVDEAHGAHLPFIDELPMSAVSIGADIVVQSLHKTMTAMTQTAVMHVNSEKLDEGVRKYLSMFMSSSPSYVMLCSMEQAVVGAWERKNTGQGYREYLDNLQRFRENMKALKSLKLLGESAKLDKITNTLEDNAVFAYDKTRIVFYCDRSGETLANKLREIGNIEVEMSGTNYVVLISTYVDSAKDFMHLENVIKLLDEELSCEELKPNAQANKLSKEDIFSKEQLDKLVGTVALDNIYVYPPGSYIVAAGEEITKESVEKIIQLKASGKKIVGLIGE